MGDDTTTPGVRSTPCWDNLEEFARGQVQGFLQRLLEEEVEELLGRRRHQRRAEGEPPVYRNGHGRPRRLTTGVGTVEVRRPRVRGLTERFESLILPLFAKHTKKVGELLPELYLHGLAEGDFDLALRGLLGDKAPLSAASIARLKASWQAEYDAWRRRPLHDLEVVYLWADGVYVKAGLEKDKAAVLVVVAALRDGSKAVLAVESGARESTESWAAVLRDLKARGLNCPRLAVGDGHLGLWGGLAEVFPEAGEQRCWNHRIVNVLNKVPVKQQTWAKQMLSAIPAADTAGEADRRKREFQAWCSKKGFAEAGALLDKDWDRMTAFYGFPKDHWKHLRTTNPVESPFDRVRLRTTAAKRYKKAENATAVIWKTLMLAERSFRKLNAPELCAEVADGAAYVNGVRVKPAREKVPA